MAEDTMGNTDGVGLIVYVGTRAELEAKLRRRDDRITELEAMANRAWELSIVAQAEIDNGEVPMAHARLVGIAEVCAKALAR